MNKIFFFYSKPHLLREGICWILPLTYGALHYKTKSYEPYKKTTSCLKWMILFNWENINYQEATISARKLHTLTKGESKPEMNFNQDLH